jgi:hypothetical protein
MWNFIKWLIEQSIAIWTAPLEQFFTFLQGLLQFGLTILIIYIGFKLLLKGIKKL